MYCTRCGKKIDYDAFVCNECVKQEQEAVAEVKTEESAPALEATPETVTEEPVADTATAEPVQEPVNPQPTYTAPNNQQYYYSNPNTSYQQGAAQNSYQNPYQNNAYPPYTPYQPQPTTDGNPRMNGFGKSLASTLLGFFSYFFSAITLGIAEVGEPGATVLFLMMTLGMAIPSLIMGIKSIKTFTNAPKMGLPRPIATLVLGIVGISFTAIAFFICFLSLMIVGLVY